jgi:hypothetical protein
LYRLGIPLLRARTANTSHTSEEYVVRKVQENQGALKLSGAHQLLVYADDVHLLRDNIDTIKKNIEL